MWLHLDFLSQPLRDVCRSLALLQLVVAVVSTRLFLKPRDGAVHWDLNLAPLQSFTILVQI